jgi:hypothetical protein
MRKIVDTILPAQELIHAVQRGGAAPGPQDRLQLDLPRDRFEFEADLVAAATNVSGFRRTEPRSSVGRKVFCSQERFLTPFLPHLHLLEHEWTYEDHRARPYG